MRENQSARDVNSERYFAFWSPIPPYDQYWAIDLHSEDQHVYANCGKTIAAAVRKALKAWQKGGAK